MVIDALRALRGPLAVTTNDALAAGDTGVPRMAPVVASSERPTGRAGTTEYVTWVETGATVAVTAVMAVPTGRSSALDE
jgi:hypothetical protein